MIPVEWEISHRLDQTQGVRDGRRDTGRRRILHTAGDGAAIGADHEAVNAQQKSDRRNREDVKPVADLEQIGGHLDLAPSGDEQA